MAFYRTSREFLKSLKLAVAEHCLHKKWLLYFLFNNNCFLTFFVLHSRKICSHLVDLCRIVSYVFQLTIMNWLHKGCLLFFMALVCIILFFFIVFLKLSWNWTSEKVSPFWILSQKIKEHSYFFYILTRFLINWSCIHVKFIGKVATQLIFINLCWLAS